MIKPRLFATSLDAYPQDIHQFLLRGYKYLRTMSQFHEDEDMDKIIVSRFIKKTKTAKTLEKLVLKINPSCSDVKVTTEQVRSILKTHSQNLKGLDICELPCLQGKIPKGFLLPVKNIKVVRMKARNAEIKELQGFRGLERACIDMRCPKVKMNLFYMALVKLKNMKKIELLPYSVDLSRTLELLDQLTAKFGKQLNIHITALKGNENYNKLPEINGSLSKMITQLKLESIATISLLDDLFRNSAPVFTNVHKLELEFNVLDLGLVSFLKLLSTMPVLKLSLEFGDLCSKEFSQALMNNMSLPLSLQQLKIKIPLSLESYLINNVELIQNSRKRFPWRQKNYFEEEPCLQSFFKAFENTKFLRKLSFDCKMLENFSSYYTSFFTAILNRLQGLHSFEISVKEFSKQESVGQEPECFDVALLLDCCSQMTQLQSIEVAMPNLLFEDAKLSQNLTSLKKFHIGISEHEDNETLKFSGVAKTVKGILNCLVETAPNLKSLILDFREVIDGPMFCRRFMLIEQFKNLEYLYLRMVIEKCNTQKIKTVGKLLQSLKKLKTLVLHFNDSDPKMLSIKTYISYHRRIREVLLISNDAVWLGNPYMYQMDRKMGE